MINYFKYNKHKLAAIIVTGEVIVGQGLRLLSNLILTRLLIPEMFGVMMIALVFLIGITMLSDLGLREKFIQSPNAEKQEFIDTCWSMQVIRGVVITLLTLIFSFCLYLFGVAGYINENSAYAAPELPLLIAFFGFTALLNGFNSIGIYYHYRKVNLYVLAKISLISQLVGTILMLVAAFYYREIWVLLISPVLAAIIKLCLSYSYASDIRANFRLDKECLIEIISFSKWIFIGSVLSYLSINADRLLLGGFLSTAELGVFSVAFMLSMAAKDLFSKIIKDVAYPKLTHVARIMPEKFKDTMYSLRLKIDFITWSIAGFMFGFGSVFVTVLYDERYSDAGWMLEILSISLIFVGFRVNQQAIMALGKSFIFAFINAVGALYVILAIPAAYYFLSIEWVIFSIAIKAISSIPLLLYFQYKYNMLNLIKEIRMLPMFFISYFLGLYFKEIFTNLWNL
ncbi:oligosaccharide flippase family protein [Nitrincola sp.]|uniref:oligosaccharide flippase family protein n=1 Tax=Nitrincola sp. TaxID=1926584 RepID=UPI003A959AF1